MGSSVLPLASVVSALGGLLFGYELGIISGALLQLKVEFNLSCVQQEALVSSLLLGALLASTLGGWLIDRHGRRNAILLSNVLILMGSLLLLVSSYAALVVGRVTVGFAMSVSSMSCCIFVSEMVSADHRGCMVTLYEAGITVGILLAYAVNYVLSDRSGGWKWMFGLAVVPAVIQLVAICFLTPGTKRTVSYCSLKDSALVSSAGAEKPEEPRHSSAKDRKTVDSRYLFQSQDNMRTRTVIGLGLVLFQQFTGQPNILFYASTIFSSVGFHSRDAALLASVGLGLVKVVSTLAAMVLSDRVGRRTMLISGCCVMAVSLVVIGLCSGPMRAQDSCHAVNTTTRPQVAVGNQTFPNITADRTHTSENNNSRVSQAGPQTLTGLPGTVVNWVILVCMMAVVAAYSTGFGPMTWLLLTEIFPAAVRGRAFAFISSFNWAANLLVTSTFLNAVDLLGLSGIFCLYGTTAVLAAVFFYFLLPETKGKTLEDIDKELRLSRSYPSDQCCGCVTLRNSTSQYQRVNCHSVVE